MPAIRVATIYAELDILVFYVKVAIITGSFGRDCINIR